MPEPIGAQVEITEAQCVEAYLGYAKHRKLIVGLQKMMGIVVLVIGFFVATRWPVVPGVWTATLIAMIAGLFLVRWQWVWIARRGFSALPAARRNYEVTFADDGVREKGPRAEVRFAWSTLDEWIETEHLIVALTASGVAGHWAKDAFTPEQLADLRSLLDAKIERPAPAEPEAPKRGGALKTLVIWVFLIALFVAIYQLVVNP